jgi:hypothetical protein
MPEQEWLDGRRQVVCSARLEVSDRTDHPGRTAVKPHTSADRRILLNKVSGEALPIEFRQCRAYDHDRSAVSAVSCAKPHVDETLLYFEADGVFDQRFIHSLERRPTPKKFDQLDDVCTDALPQVLGPDYDRKKLRGFGSVARRWTSQNKTVRCSVGPVDFRKNDLPSGSLVGTGAATVELIRAK